MKFSFVYVSVPLYIAASLNSVAHSHRLGIRANAMTMMQQTPPSTGELESATDWRAQDKMCEFRALIVVDGFPGEVTDRGIARQEQLRISVDQLQTVFPAAHFGLSRGTNRDPSCLASILPIGDMPLPEIPRNDIFGPPQAMQNNPFQVIVTATEEVARTNREPIGTLPGFIVIITDVPLPGQTDVAWPDLAEVTEIPISPPFETMSTMYCAEQEPPSELSVKKAIQDAEIRRVIILVPKRLESGYREAFSPFSSNLQVVGFNRASDVGHHVTRAIKATAVCQRGSPRRADRSVASKKGAQKSGVMKWVERIPAGLTIGALGAGSYWLAQRGLDQYRPSKPVQQLQPNQTEALSSATPSFLLASFSHILALALCSTALGLSGIQL